MTESWSMPQSRQQRIARTQRSRLMGTVDGRLGGTAPPPPPPLDRDSMTMTPGEVFNSFNQVFQTWQNNAIYQQFISTFVQELGDFINNEVNNTVVTNFLGDLLTEITQYFDEQTNNITQSFVEEILQEITYYLTHNDNSVTENYAGAVLKEITQYINKYPNSSIVKQFQNALTEVFNIGVVKVQPDEPTGMAIGGLWFDTDDVT